MEKQKLLTYLEVIWWVVTLIVVVLVMQPIFTNFGWKYPFLWWNIGFIICFITYTRYAFLLKHTFIAHRTRAKIFLFFFSVPYLFFGIEAIWKFQEFWDNRDSIGLTDMFLQSISEQAERNLYDYIHNETMLFGIGAVLAGVLMAFRLTISFWRERNKGTV